MSTWDLSSIYSTDAAFEQDIAFVKRVLCNPGKDLKSAILELQEAAKILKQLDSYVFCLIAENPSDSSAQAREGEFSSLQAEYDGAHFVLGFRLSELEEETFGKLIQDPELSPIAFILEEMCDFARKKASKQTEEVINALTGDGYHGLWSLYQTITSKIKIGPKQLSMGQADNLLHDSDQAVRQEIFADYNETMKKEADLLAQVLNRIGGFRLKVYEQRGWEDPLYEPLYLNRMKKETFDAMWGAIQEAKPAFERYLKSKAELLGVEKLSWCDVAAPLYPTKEIPYEEGAKLILEQFEAFHPKMAVFSKNAMEKRWIEAEDRPGKAAGGFCVSFPKSQESRIFMTYKGTPNNVTTLAHELGHGYHNSCVEHLPYFLQQAAMNVAEAASTFGEMVVIDQTIAKAADPKEKLQLLDDKLQRSVSYFMNLEARLLFEIRFYAKRKKGFVPAKELCILMEEAQKEAYNGALADWYPYFWASKLHFYCTYVPFYNFPYTFGYLLSNGLYALSKEGDFGPKFDGFLEDTAQMSVEDLAKKHLGVDLTKPDFWQASLQLLTQDVDTFQNLTANI